MKEQKVTVAEFHQMLQNGGTYEIFTPNGWVKVNEFYDRGDRSCLFISTKKHHITVSKDHRFFVNDKWTLAKDLQEGDQIFTANGYEEIIEIKLVGKQQVYDLNVDSLDHSYYSNDIVSHNCGKSAIVEGLALRIVNGDVPDSLKDKEIYALDLPGMLAGTKFRGEFEERLQNTMKDVAANPNIILFIDEIHNICGAGGNSDGGMDASNIVKPYLSRGELRCIGATTYEEYKKHIEKDKAFCRRFKKIDIDEPSAEETLKILKGLKSKYEEYHGVKFPDDMLEYIVKLSGRYIIDRAFPDKAIDIMDEIGAKYHSGLVHGDTVQKVDVESVICAIANIPQITADENDKDKLKTLGDTIKQNLFGQDEVVDKVVKQIRMTKAGIANKGKPLSCALISSTGCGKTEFAKQLAAALGIGLVKLDMSEYSEEYAVSKLIGSAVGYVGYDQAGALTEPLIRQPHCVVLLDEIEKAHKNVYNLLLQVLDEGRLTDNHNKEASFRNAIILMTSNIGTAAADNANSPLGFISTDKDLKNKQEKILTEEFKKKFPPEFRNRLTNVFYFNPLDEKSMSAIVDKNIRRINESIKDKNVEISITDEARKYFVNEAKKENAGGRPIERLIDENVSMLVADEILFGRLEHGGKVAVRVKDKKIKLDYAVQEC